MAVTFTVIALLLGANVRTNRALGRSNVALQSKTTESEERRVEAEQSAALARNNEQRALDERNRADREAEAALAARDDVLRLSALQRLDDLTAEADRLWPAHPENIERYQRWLERAEALVAELPGHERKLAELRTKARPWTAEGQSRHRAEHPRLAELERDQRHLGYHRRLASALESDAPLQDPSPEEVGVDSATFVADANALNDLAWDMVRSDREDWGAEAEGLVLARRAVELAAELPPEERAGIRDTLAWALFANGRFDEAVTEEEQALAEVAAEKKAEYEGRLSDLNEAVEDEIDPEMEPGRSKHVAELEERIATLEAEISARPEWTFDDDQDKWWHNQLEKLVNGIRAFADEETGLFSEGTSEEHGWGVKKRLSSAVSLRDGFAPGGEQAQAWAKALPEIRAAYPGLALTPQLGLVPLGADPESKLWEFAHLETGAPAVRGEDGKLALTEETGLVFVLLPGGTFRMGAQKGDPSGPNYDPQAQSDEDPVHEVTLSAFFLSKYEMTQGQWLRFVGRNPSAYGPDRYFTSWNAGRKGWSSLHPVEQVSWIDCVEVMGRAGLTLPTEAQWEYGCRGGTGSVFWSGQDQSTLQGVANLSDAYGKSHGNEDWTLWESWLDDGQTAHAEVGGYRANGFGLHDTHGNVWEWCLDGYDESFYGKAAAKDPVSPPTGSSLRVNRGGGFASAAVDARSAVRVNDTPSRADSNLGLRPARTIAP